MRHIEMKRRIRARTNLKLARSMVRPASLVCPSSASTKSCFVDTPFASILIIRRGYRKKLFLSWSITPSGECCKNRFKTRIFRTIVTNDRKYMINFDVFVMMQRGTTGLNGRLTLWMHPIVRSSYLSDRPRKLMPSRDSLARLLFMKGNLREPTRTLSDAGPD